MSITLTYRDNAPLPNQIDMWRLDVDDNIEFRKFIDGKCVDVGSYGSEISSAHIRILVNFLRNKSMLLLPQIVESLMTSFNSEANIVTALATLMEDV